MSVSEYDPRPSNGEEITANIIEELCQSQASLFTCIERYFKKSNSLNARLLDAQAEESQHFFGLSAGVIASCDDLPKSTRAIRIASVCMGIEMGRLEFLRELAPQGGFEDPSETLQDLVELFSGLLVQKTSPVNIASVVEDGYAGSYAADLTELESLPRPPHFSFEVRDFARDAAATVRRPGVLLAGITAGAIIVGRQLRQS